MYNAYDVRSICRRLLVPTLAGLLFGGCDTAPAVLEPAVPDEADQPNEAAPSESRANGSGEIVFASNRDGYSDIYAMHADGSGLVRLTNTPEVDFRPSWSPDGTKIAFQKGRTDGNPHGDIYVMNADGSNPVLVMTDASQPKWSPDGDKIAFWRLREVDTFWGLTTDIWIMDADGSNARRLISDGWYPAWSPDGTKIAFAASGETYVMDADGSNVGRLVRGSHPAWSPDGHWIAVTSDLDGGNDIYLVALDGSDPVRLTDHAGTNWQPTWSPDGSQIAFQSDRTGDPDVYVMNADGSDPVNLTNHAWRDDWPSWAPAVPGGGAR